jgi:hypothetical protein
MNAYELAKGLDQFSDLGGDFFGKCANVLRQQATLIDYYKVRDDSHIKIIKAQADRIAELETVLRSIANEPIELSHDKIKWQCQDHIRWAKEILK